MNVERLIQDYHQLLGCAQDLVDSTGRVYAPTCGCGFAIRHWKETTEVWVCGRCGDPWPHQDVEVLKGEVCRASRLGRPIPAPRPGEHEDRLAAVADFGYHMNAMLGEDYWRWSTQILVGHALTSLGYVDIAQHANLFEWPRRRGGEWTESAARDAAYRARRELENRVRRRG